jgi:hypothetical protein
MGNVCSVPLLLGGLACDSEVAADILNNKFGKLAGEIMHESRVYWTTAVKGRSVEIVDGS